MAEPKNPFDFGTGSIDKDQWLRDIDAEQGNFVSQYSSAVNKHRATLMREAFADLRRRIANGDMLNRTADGLYQFGSALSREDKHMQEAYQRALGFMGDLARRQIQAPPAAEPEKKKYSTKTLNERFIKYFNPSGSQESFTSLWNSYDDAKRKEQILKFLRDELNGLSNYQDVEDYESLDKLKERINEFLSDSNITNLNRLGFTKNYLSLLKTEEQLEELPKTEEEQVALDLETQRKQYLLEQNKKVLEGLQNASEGTLSFTWTPGNYEDYLNNYFYNTLGYSQNNPYIKAGVQFEQDEKDEKGNVIFRNRPYTTKKQLLQSDKLFDIILNQYANRFKHGYLRDLENYFSNFGTRYESLYNDNKEVLRNNLSKLFATADNLGVANWENYFTKTNDGYVINGSLDDHGNYAILTPQGIIKRNMYKDSYIQSLLQYKEGGVIKGADGFVFDASKYHTKLNSTPTSPEQPNSTPELENSELENSEKMDFGDIVNIAGPLALDIASMISANGVGVGTAISAGSGLASTIWQGINDWDNNDVWGSLGGIGTNLVADGIGLIPGLGISGKVGKIAKGLAKHAKYLGLAFNAIGAHDAAQVLYKGFKTGFDLSPDEWKTLSYGLAGIAQGGAGVKRANRVNLRRGAANKRVDVTYDKNGKKHIKVTDKLESESPIGTEDTKYVATKESLIGTRGITKGNRITSAPSKRYKLMLEQPKDNIILYPWETIQRPSIDLFGAKKINKTYEESLEWLKKKKAKRNGTTTTETPAEAPKETAKERYGGILKALRKGGIIKAKWGDDTSDWMTPLYNPESSKKEEEAIYTNPYFPNIKYNGTAPWYKSRFSGESVVNLGNDDSGRANLPGGLTGNNLDYAFARNQAYVKSGQLNKLADILGYFDLLPSPVDANDLQGLTAIYNKAIDELYLPFTSGENVPDYLKTDATKHNLLFRLVYGSRAKVNGGDDNYDIGWNQDIIKTFGSASFARRPVNYETKWEDDLKNNLALAKDRVSKISHNGIEGYVYTDENGRIHPLTDDLLKLINGQQAPQKLDKEKESPKATDSEGERKTISETKYKNPTDPTPYIIAGKTAMGLLGNRNIYKNLLDEMPQAPLRDPIDRKLAIVGWQEAIKQGLNQLADLRNATWMQHGSNQLDNLAGMYETEGKGRDIMNGQYMKDSGRQFETAGKSWNLDNEDTLYNLGVGDANRRAIADRARMMAQIRAAWRSGDNNIIMGALSDAGNWMMKNYQRESDLIDLVKQLQLGTREQFMENYVRNKHSDYDSLKAKLVDPNTSDTEKANIRTKIQQWHLDAIKEAPEQWGLKLYNSFHRPGFGGGPYTTIAAKDGTKLEVAKLKARSKDNDRYVSMIKDLRATRSRRRRR